MLGEAFLVAPLVAPGGARDIALPAGEWYDFFDPSGDAIAGAQTLPAYDLSQPGRVGLFVKRGAIVPMNVVDDVTGHGTRASAGALTVLVWPGATETRFVVHDTDEATTEIRASPAGVTISRSVATTLVRIWTGAAPSAVTVEGAPAADRADRSTFDSASDGWFYEPGTRSLWVKVGPLASPRTIAWE